MYLPRVCLQICTYVVALHMFPLSHYDLFQVGNKDMTRVLLYNICWHIFCSLTLNHQNCRTILLLTAHKTFLGFFCSLVSLAAHRFGHVEFRISKIEYLFWFLSTAPAWKKQLDIGYSKFNMSKSMSCQGQIIR